MDTCVFLKRRAAFAQFPHTFKQEKCRMNGIIYLVGLVVVVLFVLSMLGLR